jgi:hypothetical protein
MKAFTRIACRVLLAASTISGAACAQNASSAGSWQWSQTGDGNFDVTWITPQPRPQQGGGIAQLVGGGEDMKILFADTPRLLQAPVVASLTGGGDDASISCTAPGGNRQIFVGASAVPGRRG